MRLYCSNCGKAVSNTVPDETFVRAWIECVECIEKSKDASELLREYAEEKQGRCTLRKITRNWSELKEFASWLDSRKCF